MGRKKKEGGTERKFRRQLTREDRQKKKVDKIEVLNNQIDKLQKQLDWIERKEEKTSRKKGNQDPLQKSKTKAMLEELDAKRETKENRIEEKCARVKRLEKEIEEENRKAGMSRRESLKNHLQDSEKKEWFGWSSKFNFKYKRKI